MATQSVFPLTAKAHFQALLQGNVMGRTPHFVLHVRRLPSTTADTGSERYASSSPVYVGMVIPKRWARRAVTRNAIKRQIRAIAAECVSSWSGLVIVVRLRAMFSASQYVSATSHPLRQAVRAELLELFASLNAHKLAAWPVYSLENERSGRRQAQRHLEASSDGTAHSVKELAVVRADTRSAQEDS